MPCHFVFELRWTLSACLFLSSLAWCGGAAADWPEFRGPTGQGAASGDVPLELDVEQAVWKQAIPGKGWSSPVVADGRIFLTTAEPDNDGGQRLYVLGVDAGTGEIQFQTELFQHPKAKIHSKNSHASPTPIVRNGRVYVHFGPHGTAAVDTDGRVLWKNESLDYPPVHGNGGSPVLVGNSLIFSADGAKAPFIAALSTEDGSVQWRTERPSDARKKFSFSTPLAVRSGGKTLVISPGSDRLSALDAETGLELWHADYTGYSVIPRPVEGHGMVFFSTSYDRPTAMAVRLGGKGNVTDTHVAWTLNKGAPHTPSMILQGDELYMVADNGIASCVNAKTGELHWRERLGSGYSASPIRVDERIYFFSEEGQCHVVACGQEFKLLAESDLGERTLASPAVVENALIIRTENNLYRFQ